MIEVLWRVQWKITLTSTFSKVIMSFSSLSSTLPLLPFANAHMQHQHQKSIP